MKKLVTCVIAAAACSVSGSVAAIPFRGEGRWEDMRHLSQHQEVSCSSEESCTVFDTMMSAAGAGAARKREP